jgi:hypothetical protein
VYRRYASLFFLVGVDEEEVREKREKRKGVEGRGRPPFFCPGARTQTFTDQTNKQQNNDTE